MNFGCKLFYATPQNIAVMIINDHHRYIKWEKQHNSYPAILDEHDLDAILTNDYFFARKFEKEYSHSFIEVLDKANKN